MMKRTFILCGLVLFLATHSNAASSLTFGAATSDRVNHGSGSTLDNLDPFTWMAWVRPTTLTDARAIIVKDDNSGGSLKHLRLLGTAGNVQAFTTRATQNTRYETNDTPLSALNAWVFIAVVYNSAAAANNLFHIYAGSQTVLARERTYAVTQDGSGAVTADAAGFLSVGNEGPGYTRAFQGDIGPVEISTRALSLAEIQDHQSQPHFSGGNVLFTYEGFNGTGTQADLSGNGNSGTVTGATASTLGPPIFIGGGPL